MTMPRRFAGTTAVLLVGLFSRCESALAQDVQPHAEPQGADRQSADVQSPQITEVIVTARRRSELLQRVPEQITVFDTADIEQAHIASYQDFSALTPNFQSFEGFRRGVFNISVRGIPTVQGGEPPVTVLVDGVQAAGLDFINQDLFDLQSIQVLRGPQGATYGRGAIGGAILITTKPPADVFEARAQAGWTSAIEEYRVNGSVSGPLVDDKLAVRLAGSYADRRGFLKNSFAGGHCDFAEDKVARVHARYTPTDSITVDAKVNYLNGRDSAGCVTITSDADPFLRNGENFPGDLPRDFKQYDDRKLMESALKVDWSTSAGTLVSASSFQTSRSDQAGDSDFGPVIQPVFFENPVDVDAWNTNLYWASADRGPLTWIVGGFFQDRETTNVLRAGLGPLPLRSQLFVNSNQLDISTAWAVYGEATYRPAEKWELSASLRYDEDKRESEDREAAGSFITKTFTALQPHGSVSYFWSDRLTTYASVGRGFRSGGFNSLADSTAVGLTDRQFDKETATNYEVGFKSTLFDGRLALNGAVFHTDFENQQSLFIDVAHTARIVLTLPQTTINGAEIEAVVQPVDRLELRAALGIADGEIEEGGPTGRDGAHSPKAHRDTLNLSAQYDFLLSRALTLRPRAEYERRGAIYYDTFDRFRYPPTHFVNAMLTLEAGRWAISAVARNLTDERIPTDFGPDSFGAGFHSLVQNLPRRFGLEFRTNL